MLCLTLHSQYHKLVVNLHFSSTTIWRVIKCSDNIVRSKMVSAPCLTVAHKENRVKLARENMARDWKKVCHTFYVKLNNFYKFQLNLQLIKYLCCRLFTLMKKIQSGMAQMVSMNIGLICGRNQYLSTKNFCGCCMVYNV